MRVLHIVTAWPRSDGDVITPWLVETLCRLRDRGVQCEVLAPSYRGEGAVEVRGIPVHRYRYAPAAFETLTHDATAMDSLARRPWMACWLPSLICGGAAEAARLAPRFDAIHVHWPLPLALQGLYAKWKSGTPVVQSYYTAEFALLRKLPALALLLRFLARKADAVTAISSYAEGLLAPLYSGPIQRIPFGAALEPSGPVHSPPHADAFEVLFIGRLVERKGVRHLIEAAALWDEPTPLVVHVVGDGPLRSELEEEVRRLGVQQRVHLHGFLDTEQLRMRLSRAGAFVLPAVLDRRGDTEGLGVVLLEAMLAGCPVVASEVGGIVDIVRHEETGLLVPPGDAASLGQALGRLSRDPALAQRLARQGRVHAEQRFGWERITTDLADLYRRVASRFSA